MDPVQYAGVIPQRLLVMGAKGYVSWKTLRDDNRFKYRWDGQEFVFSYPNERALTYFYGAIDEASGVTGREEVPLDILQLPNHVDGIIDAGAHFGTYTVLLGVLNRGVPLIVFEPSSFNRSVLEDNVAVNDLDADVRGDIISESAGVKALFAGPCERRHVHLYDDTVGHTITKGGESISGGDVKQSTKLSDVISEEGWRNPFVKIDIEGAEVGAMRDLLDADTDTVQGIVELHPDRLPESEEDKTHDILFWFEDRDFNFECVKTKGGDRPAYWFSSA